MKNIAHQSPLYGQLYKEAFWGIYQWPFHFPKSLDDSPNGLLINKKRIDKLIWLLINKLSLREDTSISDMTRWILVRNHINNRLDLAKSWIPEEIIDENEILILHNLMQEYNLDTISRDHNLTLKGHAEEILTTLDPTLQWTLY